MMKKILVILLLLLLSACQSTEPKRRAVAYISPTPEMLIRPPTDTPVGADVRITFTAMMAEHLTEQAAATSTPEPPHMPRNTLAPTSSGSRCRIKGNVNSKGEKYYHCPNFPTYSRTKVNLSEGDRWFCTESEAIAAGFKSGSKGYGCQY